MDFIAILATNFFTQFPFLNDIFQAQNCDDTRPRSAPASPPPQFTDTPVSADTLIDCDGRRRSTTAGDVISPPDDDNDRLTAARCDNTAVTLCMRSTPAITPMMTGITHCCVTLQQARCARLVCLHERLKLTQTLFTTTRVTQARQAETPSAAKCTNRLIRDAT